MEGVLPGDVARDGKSLEGPKAVLQLGSHQGRVCVPCPPRWRPQHLLLHLPEAAHPSAPRQLRVHHQQLLQPPGCDVSNQHCQHPGGHLGTLTAPSGGAQAPLPQPSSSRQVLSLQRCHQEGEAAVCRSRGRVGEGAPEALPEPGKLSLPCCQPPSQPCTASSQQDLTLSLLRRAKLFYLTYLS